MQLSDPLIPVERAVQRSLSRLPPWLSRWLGYRGEKLGPSPTWIVCLWGFIGAFGGLSVVMAVMGFDSEFTGRAVPPIVASFGASAILVYGAIDVPLAQPRSLIFGHFFSALVGVIVVTIFGYDLQQGDGHPKLQWLAASLASAIALVVMHLTKTTHPPAGATALMPCVDPTIWALRWYFLPVVLVSSVLVLAVSLVTNNIQRQYPKFWFAQIPPPAAPVAKKEEGRKEEEERPIGNASAEASGLSLESSEDKKNELADLERGPL